MIKYKALRMLVQARAWADTNNGETVIVRTLSVLTVVLIVDILFLMFGLLNN